MNGHAVQVVEDRMLVEKGGGGGRRGRKHSIPHGQQVGRTVFEQKSLEYTLHVLSTLSHGPRK